MSPERVTKVIGYRKTREEYGVEAPLWSAEDVVVVAIDLCPSGGGLMMVTIRVVG